jgi:FG-GAP-like repeat/PASTA domain/FG-GAP repeat
MRIAVVLAGVIVLGSSLGVAALGTGSAPSFARARNYATGSGPNSVAIGDLNGDRKPDLATANFGTEENAGKTLSVLLNRGNGSFRPQLDYGTGSRPVSVAIGDLNGDRKPDLATANRGRTVSVLVNRGDGSFQAKLDYAAGYPNSVAIGDLNGDGRPDLVTAGGTVSVLINTPGLCTVQDVFRQTLPAAKRTLARANCRVGKIRRVYSKWAKRGRVISQKPKRGTVLPNRGKVNLVVSRGRKGS